MSERLVTISTPDGPMDAFLALPDPARSATQTPGPAVVVVQEAFGVNDHIKSVCRRFAAAGFAAIAPEIFHRSGRGLEFGYDDFSKVMPTFSRLRNDEIETDIQAALSHLRGLPEVAASRVGIVGFCIGGFVSFLAACRTDVATAVSFYGGGMVRSRPGMALTPLLGEADGIRAPLLCIFGAEDTSIPQSDVDAIEARLSALGKAHEIVVFPGAGHAFFCEARASYRKNAALEAWDKTLEWLGRTLGS